MGRQKKHRKQKIEKKPSWLASIYRFFIPKNFMAEAQRGREIGAQPGQIMGNVMFQLGKRIRRVVDPKHKMKFGKEKGNGSQGTGTK